MEFARQSHFRLRVVYLEGRSNTRTPLVIGCQRRKQSSDGSVVLLPGVAGMAMLPRLLLLPMMMFLLWLLLLLV